jgi:hypothetical protein
MNALLLCLLAALGQSDVDMSLTPSTQNVTPGCVACVDVVLSTAGTSAVSAVDVIISWDPAEVSLVQAVPNPAYSWLATGFLNDPDGINDDVTDGQALYTALASPLSPISVPPSANIVTFQFMVIGDAEIEVLPSLGTFGVTKVVGTSPGEILTGVLPGAAVGVTTAIGTWTDLGGASPGVAGFPVLTGTGTLASNCPASLMLTNAPPNELCLIWIALNPTPFMAIDGTVWAFPYINQLLFVTNGAGMFGAGTLWPKGIPDGTDVYFQFFMQDLTTRHGITMSNGLLATTPIP